MPNVLSPLARCRALGLSVSCCVDTHTCSPAGRPQDSDSPASVHLSELRILHKLGDGGFSGVYSVMDSRDSVLALKLIKPACVICRGEVCTARMRVHAYIHAQPAGQVPLLCGHARTTQHAALPLASAYAC